MSHDSKPNVILANTRFRFLLLGSVLVALAVWIVLPSMVVVFNDDFGYLRSVVETVRHGRAWTDDWLEPWAASLSLVSGLIYKATGSFSLATQGLQAVMAGVSFWAMAVLFVWRAVPVWVAMALSAVIIFIPTLMVKWAEFTALVLYVPCLLWAIHLAEKRRWILFFVVWALAVTSRQSALAWLALPGAAVLNPLFSKSGEKRSRVILPMAVCLVGLVVFWFIGRSMNVTHAQRVMTTAMWRSLSFVPIATHFALCASIFLVSVGCAGFLMRVFGARIEAQGAKKNGWSRWLRVCLAVVVVGIFCVDLRESVAFEHPFYAEGVGRLYLGIFFGLGAAGWLLGGFRLQLGHVVCAVGCGLVASLRGTIYDYYLIDVAIIGFFSVLPARISTEGADRVGCFRWSILAVVGGTVCLVLAGFELVFLGKEERILDRYAAVIRLCEPELRAGKIVPSELSVGPFGYYAWHLYPYFIQHEGANGAFIGDIEYYLKRNSLVATFNACSRDQQKQEELLREARAQEGTLAVGVFEIGWRGPFLFVLRRTGQPAEAKYHLEPGQYRLEPFPLNDTEWRQLIEGS